MLALRDIDATRGPTVVAWPIIALAAFVYLGVQPHGGTGAAEFLVEEATIPCAVTSGEP